MSSVEKGKFQNLDFVYHTGNFRSLNVKCEIIKYMIVWTLKWFSSNEEEKSSDPQEFDFSGQPLTSRDVIYTDTSSDILGATAISNEDIPVVKTYVYIQMELCRGQNLYEWIQSTPDRTKEDVIMKYGQVLDAVEYMHRKRFFHRDLKVSTLKHSKGTSKPEFKKS